MIRWLALIAVAVGVIVGVALPRLVAGNLTGKQLAVALTPPTLASGSSPTLNCGFHGTCLSPFNDGQELDWEDGGTNFGNPWYFRGFFYVSDSNRTAFRMFPLVSVQDPARCDVMTVWIAEIHSGALMAIPTYTHVNITDSASFDWSGGPITIYNSKKIGETIDEMLPSCSTGSHVHESHTAYLTNLVAITRRLGNLPSGYPSSVDLDGTGPMIACTDACGSHKNNDINKWTRRFAWAEGAAPH